MRNGRSFCKRGCASKNAVDQASRVAALSAAFLRGSGALQDSSCLQAAVPEDAVPVSQMDIAIPEEVSSLLTIYEPQLIPLGEYLVSIQVRSNFRRLHRHGSCSLRAGVDFARFELLGSTEPEAYSSAASSPTDSE